MGQVKGQLDGHAQELLYKLTNHISELLEKNRALTEENQRLSARIGQCHQHEYTVCCRHCGEKEKDYT